MIWLCAAQKQIGPFLILVSTRRPKIRPVLRKVAVQLSHTFEAICNERHLSAASYHGTQLPPWEKSLCYRIVTLYRQTLHVSAAHPQYYYSNCTVGASPSQFRNHPGYEMQAGQWATDSDLRPRSRRPVLERPRRRSPRLFCPAGPPSFRASCERVGRHSIPFEPSFTSRFFFT